MNKIKMEKNSIAFFKIGKYKIYFPDKKFNDNFEKIYKDFSEKNKNEPGLLDLKTISSSIIGDGTKERHRLTYKFLLNELQKLSEEEFAMKWVWFEIKNKDEIRRELGEILYFYVTFNKLGNVYYGNDDNENNKEVVNIGKVSFSILTDEVLKITYHNNTLIIKTIKNIYNFEKDLVFIDSINIK